MTIPNTYDKETNHEILFIICLSVCNVVYAEPKPVPETSEPVSEPIPVPETSEPELEPAPETLEPKPVPNVTNLDAKQINELEPQVFAILTPEQMAGFTKEAFNGLTVEQFNEIPKATMSGLTTENMGGLSTNVIGNLTSEHFKAIDSKQFQQMPSEDISKFMTNIDINKVNIQELQEILPSDWSIDSDSGELIPPIGAKLTLPTLPVSATVPNNVTLPNIPNLNASFSVGGQGVSVQDNIQTSLTNTAEKDGINFIISQDEIGIITSKMVINGETAEHSFILDTDNSVQVDTNEVSTGLSIGPGGFFNVTTLDGQQYKAIPAPKDPVALKKQ